MSSTTTPIVQQLHHDFQALVDYLSGPQAHAQTAYTVELTLFRRLLALGATLLQLFFLTRAAQRPAAPATPDGTVFTYHDQRPIAYYSVFGKLSLRRHYFVAPQHQGCCPLDAALSLPERCYSDLLREWSDYDTTDAAYRETATTIERILDLDLSLQALEHNVCSDAQDVAAFYAQRLPLSQPDTTASILVVQADGKGVPMVQPPASTAPLRLGKGHKRTKKKEAVVTCVYTIAPYVRTPADVRAALMHDQPRRQPASRPQPHSKEMRATLDGKATAMHHLLQAATQRDTASISTRVALTDGAESLQQHITTTFPDYTLILDIIHASEYLWDTATALLGETNPQRHEWVGTKLDGVLNGQTASVLEQLHHELTCPTWSPTQRRAIERTCGYYERNQAYMRYDHYLAQGWPIGTGVVEGACGHLVKDRMEQAGMRWTKGGAQAILDLRAVRLNNDWDAYWLFHRQQQHRRLYGTTPATPAPEAQLFQMAA